MEQHFDKNTNFLYHFEKFLPQIISYLGVETKDEKFGIGTVNTICDIVKKQQLSNPAIIVVGDVVKQRVALNSIAKQVETLKVA